MIRARLLTLLLLTAIVSPAFAEDQLVAGSSLRIGRRGGKLRMLSNADPRLEDGTGDPLLHGGSLRILTANGFDGRWDLPAARWRKTKKGYRLRPTKPLRAVVVESGRIKLLAHGLPIPLESHPAPVHVILSLGTQRYCLTFGDADATFRPGARFQTLDGNAPPRCGDVPPTSVVLGEDRTAEACSAVDVEATVTGDPSALRWEVDGIPLLQLEPDGARVRFQAPALAVDTALTLRLTADFPDGTTLSDEAIVTVPAAMPDSDLATGMVRDCAPFREGVASGDPRADGVVLWTRLTADGPATVTWEVAADPFFATLTASGTAVADAAGDHTVKVVVAGLEAGTTYYYRFRAPDGRTSSLGRTRTAPVGPVAGLRFAAASCSSVYSGWFNAYRRIAERDDLDLLIHVGDYVYDFVDEEEQIRVPAIFPTEPQSLEEWRALHAYYLADPDLRMARAVHPWMLMWDNHDVDRGAAPTFNGSVQAFREWNPITDTDPARPEIAYRRHRFGDLVDVVLLDVLLHRERDLVPGTSAPSILGTEQFAWLAEELRASPAAWRVFGSQKVMGTVRVNPDLMESFLGERREVFDTGTWDGFPESRTQFFGLLTDEKLADNLVISGDSHISAVMDLVDDPANPTTPYDPATSDASVGVEMLPTSISRGNFDETLLGLGLTPEIIAGVLPSLVAETLTRNPHHLYLELSLHGYGVLDVTPARIVAEIWYSAILARADEETLGATFTVERGANQWTR